MLGVAARPVLSAQAWRLVSRAGLPLYGRPLTSLRPTLFRSRSDEETPQVRTTVACRSLQHFGIRLLLAGQNRKDLGQYSTLGLLTQAAAKDLILVDVKIGERVIETLNFEAPHRADQVIYTLGLLKYKGSLRDNSHYLTKYHELQPGKPYTFVCEEPLLSMFLALPPALHLHCAFRSI